MHCRGCDTSKPTTAFYRHQGQPYGPCKGCRCAKARARYQATASELEHLRILVANSAAKPGVSSRAAAGPRPVNAGSPMTGRGRPTLEVGA